MVSLVVLQILASVATAHSSSIVPRRPAPIPPSLYERKTVSTNQTMDQIIFDVMGGKKVSSNFELRPRPGGSFLAELDMVLTKDQYYSLYDNQTDNSLVKKRKATMSANRRWTNNEVVYKIANNHFSLEEIYHLKRAMREWERYTCLRFRPAQTTDRNVVRIQNGQGCNSMLGMVGGTQALNLETPGCRYKGLYIHEIGHAIGLVHEHQLPNRDKFIEIIYNNVEPHMRQWFNKYKTSEVNQYDVAYEYSSVMHYGITAFSSDGTSQTIRAKQPHLEHTIGKVYQKELSFTDTKIVNRMYGCGESCPNIRCGDGGFVDENCQCVCKDGTHDCQNGSHQPNGRCVNSHEDSWQCYIWAQQGECGNNADFMKSQCAKACGVCQKIHDPMPGRCGNFYPEDKCEKWSDAGDCVTNEKWMEVNCRKTCKGCGSSDNAKVNCDNIHTDNAKCDEWAKRGECQVNVDWMFDNCKKSCMMCDRKDKPTTDGRDENEPGVCINDYDDEQCDYWAGQGECEKNPSWMKVNCRKSCRVCTRGGECADLYDTEQCRGWADLGECEKNPSWMKENCRKSCRECRDSGRCANDHDDTECDGWAGVGECQRNPSWMLKHCKKSCNVCRNDRGTTDPDHSGGDNGSNRLSPLICLSLPVLFMSLLL